MAPSYFAFPQSLNLEQDFLFHLWSLVVSKQEVLGEYAEDVEVIRVEDVEVIRVEEVEEVLCTWCSLWPWLGFSIKLKQKRCRVETKMVEERVYKIVCK